MSEDKRFTTILTPAKVISWLIISLILFFLLRFLYKNWLEVSTYSFRVRYDYLVVSIVLLLNFFFARVWCWRVILKKMHIVLSMRKSLKVSFLSMMGKYLPGKVWSVLGKVYLSGKEGVPKIEAFASVVMEIVLEIVASIFFFLFFLFSFLEQPLLSLKAVYSLTGVMILGLIALHPKLFYWMVNLIVRRWKGEEVKKTIRYRDIIQLFMLYNGIVLLQGIAFYFFVNALCDVPVNNILGLTGSLAIAGVLGTLSFFTPSGLGVREGVLAVLLTTYVISPVAVLISLIARLWVTLGEVCCALFAWKL